MRVILALAAELLYYLLDDDILVRPATRNAIDELPRPRLTKVKPIGGYPGYKNSGEAAEEASELGSFSFRSMSPWSRGRNQRVPMKNW